MPTKFAETDEYLSPTEEEFAARVAAHATSSRRRSSTGMRLLSSLAILPFAACTAAHPAPEPAPVRGDSGLPQAFWPRIYFLEFDAVAQAAGLVPLRYDTLNPGREIRIWIGGGILYPQQLYRFVDRGRRVDGELVHH